MSGDDQPVCKSCRLPLTVKQQSEVVVKVFPVDTDCFDDLCGFASRKAARDGVI